MRHATGSGTAELLSIALRVERDQITIGGETQRPGAMPVVVHATLGTLQPARWPEVFIGEFLELTLSVYAYVLPTSEEPPRRSSLEYSVSESFAATALSRHPCGSS
jgi:hypothetical protein